MRTCIIFYNFAGNLTNNMTLAVRFRFFEAKTPTFDIVELTVDQWREFFWLNNSQMRMEWMIRFLHYEPMSQELKELWWIPLDDQDELAIKNQ